MNAFIVFFFTSPWHFAGLCLLLLIVGGIITNILKSVIICILTIRHAHDKTPGGRDTEH